MTDSVQCPGCGKSYPLKEELLGRLVQCRTCGQAFRLQPPQEPKAAPAKPAAKPAPAQGQAARPAAAKPQAKPIATKPQAPKPAPAQPVKPPPPKEPLAPLSDPLSNLLEEELTAGPAVADLRPLPPAPQPTLSSSPFSGGPARPKPRQASRSGGGGGNFFATHKLLTAVILAPILSSLIFAMLGAPFFGCIQFPALVLLVPFGLLPLPPRGQSVAGKVYLIINSIFLGLYFVLLIIATIALLGKGTEATAAVTGMWIGFAINMCVSIPVMLVIAKLMTEYGFFRVSGWMYLIQSGVLMFLVIVFVAAGRTFQAWPGMGTRGGSFAATPVADGLPPAPTTTTPDALLASPHVQSMIQKHGNSQVAVVCVEGVPNGLSNFVFEKTKKAAGEATGFSGYSSSSRAIAALAPVSDLQGLAGKIDFGTVTQVDTQRRIIFVRADPARLPEPLAPEVTNPLDPKFYKQNLADLRCYDEHRRRQAVERLKRAKPKELRQEIAAALMERLAEEDSWNQREVIEALGVWGGDEIIQPLIDLLQSNDHSLRNTVLEVLARRKDPRVVEAMVGLLGEFALDVDKHLVTMGPMVEDALLERFDDLNDRGQQEACEILGQIGTEKSIPKLKELARSRDFSLQRAAEEAVRKISRTSRPARPEPPAPEATPEPEAVAGSDTKPEPKPEEPEAPKRIRSPGADDDEMAETRRPRRTTGNRIDDSLLDLTLSDSSRREAAERLGAMLPEESRRKEVAKALAEAFDDAEESWTRREIVEALMVWYTEESLPTLIDASRDDDNGIRRAAIQALTQVQDERAVKAIAERLGEDRHEAAQALKTMGPIAEKTVLEYAKHPNRDVARAAIEILGHVGGKDS